MISCSLMIAIEDRTLLLLTLCLILQTLPSYLVFLLPLSQVNFLRPNTLDKSLQLSVLSYLWWDPFLYSITIVLETSFLLFWLLSSVALICQAASFVNLWSLPSFSLTPEVLFLPLHWFQQLFLRSFNHSWLFMFKTSSQEILLKAVNITF